MGVMRDQKDKITTNVLKLNGAILRLSGNYDININLDESVQSLCIYIK